MMQKIARILLLVLLAAPSLAATTALHSPQKIYEIVETELDLNKIAQKIWEQIIGEPLVQGIEKFKHDNPIPFAKFADGATWMGLKKELDIHMAKPMPGADYSWEQFREIDKAFKEDTVNKALQQLGLKPVKWQVTGTIGYNSDIDNVAISLSSFEAITAKILFETLNIYMYGKTSDVTFDEQIYTEHPGLSLQTMKNITSEEAKEKYHKVAFSLAQLQLFRNLKNSKILPWQAYKSKLIKIFPSAQNTVEGAEKYDQELTIAKNKDRITIQKNLNLSQPIKDKDLETLIDLKAVSVLSKQILGHVRQEQRLQQGLKIKKQYGDSLLNENSDLMEVFRAAEKEKDDLLVQTALLYALCETYFPEGYYTQEAFQLIVMGDLPISQVLGVMVNESLKKGSDFKTVDELRQHLIETHKDQLISSSPFSHLISLGEQLAYMVHKLDSNHGLTPTSFVQGGKYLLRFAYSYKAVSDYLGNDDAFADQLLDKAHVIAALQRGKIYISAQRLQRDLNQFIGSSTPHLMAKEREILSQQLTDYLVAKCQTAALSPDARIQAVVSVFQNLDLPKELMTHLDKALALKPSTDGIECSDPALALDLNGLLGKSRTDNQLIRSHYDQEVRKTLKEIKLDDTEQVKLLFEKIVRAYMEAVKAFFSMPENKFNPYSLNYNEIHLGHTYDPDDLISATG